MAHVTSAEFSAVLHSGLSGRPAGDPVPPPLVPSSVFILPGMPQAAHQYGRWSNPSWSAVEDALAALERAEVVAFPSGMAAISAVLLSQLRPGDRLLLPSDGYYTTRAFSERYLTPIGVRVDHCATVDYTEHDFTGYRLVHIETPSNPALQLCDLARVLTRVKAAGALSVVDNTTMTALGQKPLDLGADLVVASDTKAVNGHSDALFGHAATRNEALAQALSDWRTHAGAIPGPFEAWLVHRGLESLEVRFERMCASAAAIAVRLAELPQGPDVVYPGLPDHPSHELARAQMIHFGFLIGVVFADEARADRFIERARFVVPATSFGGVHSSAERRARWGDRVPTGFVRLSVGCEPLESLWQDIADAVREP